MPPSNGSAAILTGLLSSSYAYTTNLIVRRNKQRTTALLDSETAAEPRTTLLPEYYEDAMIIGALTGAIIGLQRGRLPKSFGWNTAWRGYPEACVKIGVAHVPLAFWIYRNTYDGHKHNNEAAKSTHPLDLHSNPLPSISELASSAEFVRSALARAGLTYATLTTEGAEPAPGNDGSNMAMSRSRGGSNGGSLGSGGGGLGPSSGHPGSPTQLGLIIDGPHLAVKNSNDDPGFISQTNYSWYSENKIADLERHIALTRKRRQELTQEAEYLWAWLAEKEAQHFEKFPVTKQVRENDPEPTPAFFESSMIIQSLNQVHSLVWEAVSCCDWIIADSQKRIAQEKSRNLNGKIEWRWPCSEEASKSPLKTTLRSLRNTAEQQADIQNEMDQALSNLAVSISDPQADLDQMVMHPMKQKMATYKEVIKDVQEHTAKQLRVTRTFEKTLRKAIAEAEQKAGKGN